MSKCQICKQNEATWAMQFVGEDHPSFSFLGWHYRGFKVTKVCGDCYVACLGKSHDEIFPPSPQHDEDEDGYNDTVADGLTRFTR